MVSIFAVAILSGLAMAQPFQGQTSDVGSTASATTLPSIPKGKSTVIGGEIRNFDPVRDQFILHAAGNGPHIKIQFDERTKVFRDGRRISVLQLRAEDHASVETTLDGTNVFALKIHILSQLPQGECRGQVIRYNPDTAELTINEGRSQEPITLTMPAGTPILRVGQKAFTSQQGGGADLSSGALVDVKFESTGSHSVATRVNVLAIPGSSFVFDGNLSFLDMRAGRLVIMTPNDNESYQVDFDPSRFPVSNQLHEGSRVKVTTSFDGTHYVATDIMIE